MQNSIDSPTAPAKGRSRKPLLIGLVLGLAGGAGGFAAVQTGLVSLPGPAQTTAGQGADTATQPLDVAFVPLDPMVVSLPATQGRDHLRFAAQLEVPIPHQAEVAAIKPRIVDVLNGYLRAVDLAELENPATLMRMRSQMLRRVQVVAGDGRVNDLLIMEFVLN